MSGRRAKRERKLLLKVREAVGRVEGLPEVLALHTGLPEGPAVRKLGRIEAVRKHKRKLRIAAGLAARGLVTAMLILTVALTGCPKKVIRDATTFRIETLAALARQQEAYTALMAAATEATERGDWEACMGAATPAMLIEAYAAPQAYRALWLAGLQYPGTIPENGEQIDPGASPEPRNPEAVCGPDPE